MSTADLFKDFGVDWAPPVPVVFCSLFAGSFIKGVHIGFFAEGVLLTLYIVFGIESLLYWVKEKPTDLFLQMHGWLKWLSTAAGFGVRLLL